MFKITVLRLRYNKFFDLYMNQGKKLQHNSTASSVLFTVFDFQTVRINSNR